MEIPAASSYLLPTLDDLRNFLLAPTTEMRGFFRQLREALQSIVSSRTEVLDVLIWRPVIREGNQL
jgi:hypothetical protein